MKPRKKKDLTWYWIAGIIAAIYFLTRKQTRLASNKYTVVNTVDANGNTVPKVVLINGGNSANGTASQNVMTPAVLAVQYFSLMANSVRSYISDPDAGIVDLPWQLDLAKYTKDYPAVKERYLFYYDRNLTTDLLEWFTPEELSDFVAALYKNNQVLTP